MKNIKAMKKKQSPLDELLSEITPEEQEKTDVKMQLAAKISDAMAAKGWNNKMLMKAMGKKNPSEITRWLSGTHNFTVETLIDLGRVLEINFIEPQMEEKTIHQYFISVIAHNNSHISSPSIINEPENLYVSFDQTIYA